MSLQPRHENKSARHVPRINFKHLTCDSLESPDSSDSSDSNDSFAYNQCVLRLDMKTKVVKNVLSHVTHLTHLTHVNIQTFTHLNSWFSAFDFQSFLFGSLAGTKVTMHMMYPIQSLWRAALTKVHMVIDG